MEPKPLTPGDLVKILNRRKWSLILPAFFVFAVSVAVAILLPPVYRSSSTILIEDQEIPPEFVMATVSTFVEKQLQVINQRIMSSTRLLEIINDYDLYSDLREKKTTEEIISTMREDVKLQTISGNIEGGRSKKNAVATIAFTLSFEAKDSPAKVQRVANVLASLFLEENLKVRERQTKETTQFLEDEMQRVKQELEQIDHKIAGFKQTHMAALPEMLQTNLQNVSTAEAEISRVRENIESLKDKKGYLQTQLASMPRFLEEDDDKKELRDLKKQLAVLKSRYADAYPDVVNTKAMIRALEERTGLDADQLEDDPQLPDNPAYLSLSSQLAGIDTDIEFLKRRIVEYESRLDQFRKRVESTPQIEEEYKYLVLSRNNLQVKYNDLMQKSLEARVAHGLEKEQKGERFTLIDPARLPEKPFKPNRIAIMAIGLVLALGSGAGLAALREFSDKAVRSVDTLYLRTGIPVLASIPLIVTQKDLRKKRIRRGALVFGSLGLLTGCVLAFHFWVMDLDLFWIKLMRRLAL